MGLFKITAHFYQLPTGELDCELFLPGNTTHGRGSHEDVRSATFLDSWELDLSALGFPAKAIVYAVLRHISSETKIKKAATIVLSLYEKGYLRGQ
ncbi:MAG: hypothetical protein CO029_02830 [Candidatus Magasanikbacteria bacterium CG_4_9_14_0_2_um_filter_41_10]|uniref:Uncharacterized protein n=1 Tax=Candidatus Magasanikbacteria bacterium CG_4_10_14_0_2_um_filter_41_31 TaxID=1974639 RepID=A0A2M7V347_9BACT|nr:MAG: hypothetical protein AUJ37_00025 [Candidatus Magasanikbacteria bacterium CG1_02_41_34]PIZ92886.1 MAG: hypothetical protein COX83_03275 [Candidatus Magasanikbacteria bacterium CG_4_10_14_0_2_um_filter_41_31]PJC53427.1 MAG: hypothetical protein CO029_02830 [Candidatus Magasanikbacteria bacterium CG_4_9_14_0_2_um_filter_41_10]